MTETPDIGFVRGCETNFNEFRGLIDPYRSVKYPRRLVTLVIDLLFQGWHMRVKSIYAQPSLTLQIHLIASQSQNSAFVQETTSKFKQYRLVTTHLPGTMYFNSNIAKALLIATLSFQAIASPGTCIETRRN
jgi:hypothetical protein